MKFHKKYAMTMTVILMLLWSCLGSYAATTLLPNGKQCFTGPNGALSNGSVNMFVPNTTTPKANWQDSNQLALNSQPIQLDANGCIVIYGVGSYRQQVFDGPVVAGVTTGNQIWDQVTTDTSAFNSTIWGGTALASGTPNAIALMIPGFNSTDGSIVQFIAIATNTSSTTVNGAPVVKSTTAGPSSLVGGEIVSGNVISMLWSSVSNNFTLLNTVIGSASGSSGPLCGSSGLNVTNGSSPNTIAQITARQIVMQTPSGFTIQRSNVSIAVNISLGNATSTAGGMDAEAPGTSAWIDLFAIDNGSAVAGLGSLASGNGLSPNMPSGYSYKCYLGAMRVDGGGNLLRTLQLGNSSQYVLQPAGSLPVINNSATAYWTSRSITAFVPPTATRIKMILEAQIVGATQSYAVAPNANYGTNVNTSVYPPCGALTNNIGATVVNSICDIVLEATTIQVGTSGATLNLNAFGWTDAVTAN